jgi:Icc-related predicted phosphoesterase
MNVLFVADLHYALKQFDWLVAQAARYEAVIIGGDLLELAGALEIDVQILVIEKYLRRLQQITDVIVSSGNHDGDSRNAADESIARWLRDETLPRLHADGDSVVLGGHLFTVCAWWDGPATRAELEAQLAADAAREKQRWIWVHHAPPDQSPVSWNGKRFSGDEFLRGWIERYQPDLVLSGHIHNAPFYPDGSWVDRIGRTWAMNPGRQLGPKPTCVAIDLAKMTAEWVAIEGQDRRHLAAV